MRHGIFTIFILAVCTVAYGQTPESFTYQAVARDAGGDILDNQNVGLRISIIEGSISGTAIYTETHSASTNSFGLINLAIGEGTTSDNFSAIDWSMGPYFIKVEMDASGGTSYTEFGTSQLLSVPYALHAKTAENAFSGNYSELSGAPTIPSALSDLTNDLGFITDPADADSDPTNEIQDISLSGTDLSISQGSTLDLSGLSVGGSESDPEVGTNTLNFLSKWDGSSLVTSNIFDNGQIGIGNSDPTEILHITSTTTPNIRVDAPGNSGYYIGFNSAGYMAFSTVHSGTHYWDAMILKEGNLGIGKIDPGAKLDINIPGNGIQHILNISNITGGTADIASLQYDGENSPYPLVLNMNAQGDFSRPFVIKEGNVGIGSMDPVTRLHVDGVITAAGGNSDQWSETYSWGNHADAGYLTSMGAETDPEVGANTLNYLPKWDGSALVSSLIIDNGNVGIGIADPGHKLSVAGMVESTSEGFKFPDGTVQTTAAGVSSYWEKIGDDISYNLGRVSIGTTIGDQQLVLNDIFPAGGKNLMIGDDAFLTDVDVPGMMGIYGEPDLTMGAVRLGSDGPELFGKSGRLGIGTNNPNQVLHLKVDAGDPNIRVDAPGDNGYYIGFNGGGYMAFSTVHSGTPFWDTMVLREGMVGLGKTDPDARLDINIPGNGIQNIINISNISGGTADITALRYDGDNAPYPLILDLDPQGDFPRPFAINGGMVGIGIDDPHASLNINVPSSNSNPGFQIDMPDFDTQANHEIMTLTSEWSGDSQPRAPIMKIFDEEMAPILEMYRGGYSHMTSLSPGSLHFTGESGYNLNLNWEEGLLYGTSGAGFDLTINSIHPLLARKYTGVWEERINMTYDDATFNVPVEVNEDLHVTGDLQVDGAIAVTNLLPAGIIVPFAGDAGSVPDGWLLCDGSEVSRTTYANLFVTIGINYGSGDNSTTFHLPDFRGRFMRGADNGAGNDPDAASRMASNPGGNTGDVIGSWQAAATGLPGTAFEAGVSGNHSHMGTALISGNHDHVGLTSFGGGHGHIINGDGNQLYFGDVVNGDPPPGPFYGLANGGGATLATNSVSNHQHSFTTSSNGNHDHNLSVINNGNHVHTITGGDIETRPVNVSVNYIIKY